MLLNDLLQNIDIIEVNADLGVEIADVAYNSETVRHGDVFVAIEGYKTDGHKYIGDAIKKGAKCVVCQKRPQGKVPFILTKDTRKALALISKARFGNPSEKLTLIGVTGTNGKTTVTHLIGHIIERCTGSKTGIIGTVGNMIGDRELAATLTTPDCYELHSILAKMVLEGCKYAVMEVSSHSLSLERVYGLEYDTGIFTNLTPEHLDFHRTMDSYAQAKAKLFERSRCAVINSDDEYAPVMMAAGKKGRKTLTYAINDNTAGFVAEDIELYPAKTTFNAVAEGTKTPVTIHIPGTFTVYNALAAIAAAGVAGIKKEDAAKALFDFPGVRGRAETLRVQGEYTVLVDYAHTPDALANIIETARSVTQGRVITLFGCGGDRDTVKRPVMGEIAARLSDVTYITSDNPRTEEPGKIIEDILSGIQNAAELTKEGKLFVNDNRKEAICAALDNLGSGDMLIIAGKGHETYQIIGTEKTHFDDREVALEHIYRSRKNRRRNFRDTEE